MYRQAYSSHSLIQGDPENRADSNDLKVGDTMKLDSKYDDSYNVPAGTYPLSRNSNS